MGYAQQQVIWGVLPAVISIFGGIGCVCVCVCFSLPAIWLDKNGRRREGPSFLYTMPGLLKELKFAHFQARCRTTWGFGPFKFENSDDENVLIACYPSFANLSTSLQECNCLGFWDINYVTLWHKMEEHDLGQPTMMNNVPGYCSGRFFIAFDNCKLISEQGEMSFSSLRSAPPSLAKQHETVISFTDRL
jgi:hypothetical protein